MAVLPAVKCRDCGRSWNSPSLAEGLRLLGACPRCSGTLEFRDEADAAPAPVAPPAGGKPVEPHLVLGIPRR